MSNNIRNVQRTRSDDFRRVETSVEENVQGAATERVTTVKEEIVPMTVKKVVRETIVPVVTSRKVEHYEDGKVVATDHEVVPDEAVALNEYENKLTHSEVARIVDEALQRNLKALRDQLPTPAPAPVVVREETPRPAVSKIEAISGQVTNQLPPPQAKLVEAAPVVPAQEKLDYSLLLYAVVALEAAGVVYLTVLRGWLLN